MRTVSLYTYDGWDDYHHVDDDLAMAAVEQFRDRGDGIITLPIAGGTYMVVSSAVRALRVVDPADHDAVPAKGTDISLLISENGE